MPHFVYFSKEPPGRIYQRVYKGNQKFHDVFDITYTYRRDAVISTPYGKVIPIGESTDDHDLLQDKSIPMWKPFNPNLVSKSILERDLTNKTNGILWMVSHCETDSRREDYVKKLKTYLRGLSIDTMGWCGTDILPKDNIVGETFGKQLVILKTTFL